MQLIRWRNAVAALGGLLASAAIAGAQVADVGRSLQLPDWPPPHVFWLSDILLHRTAAFDADAGELRGTISSGTAGVGFTIFPLFSPDRPEIYLPETYYDRGVRGKRTDVVTIYDTSTLAPIHEIAIPAKRAEYFPGNAANALSDDGRRHGRGAGPADPEKLPYYLLIVGDPETIPYSFQYQLDVQYAVGRIHFDQPEAYYRYATSVVEAEKRGYTLPRQATFFGVANEGDRATRLSAEHLVRPLSESLAQHPSAWGIQTKVKKEATKSNLSQLFQASQPPALLFTASHGMSFPVGDPHQLLHQGALLCQDWPGPQAHKGAIPEDYYFSADDLESSANVLGMIAFFFACYGAGTPRMDDFYRKAYIERNAIAPYAFVSRLPQRMLSHPQGGALAVIGHVERDWGYSFFWTGVGKELVTFESAFTRLMDGHPVGSALEYFNERYAELASDLTSELDETTEEVQNAVKIAGLWTASNDARNTMIMGDPAVRLAVGESAAPAEQRAAILELVSQPRAQVEPMPESQAPVIVAARRT